MSKNERKKLKHDEYKFSQASIYTDFYLHFSFLLLSRCLYISFSRCIWKIYSFRLMRKKFPFFFSRSQFRFSYQCCTHYQCLVCALCTHLNEATNVYRDNNSPWYTWPQCLHLCHIWNGCIPHRHLFNQCQCYTRLHILLNEKENTQAKEYFELYRDDRDFQFFDAKHPIRYA